MIFNKDKALKQAMNDKELLRELLLFTLEDIPVMLTHINKYLEEDVKGHEIGEIAHKIKGTAGAVSGEILYETAYDLEITAKEGEQKKLSEQVHKVEKAFLDFSHSSDVLFLVGISS